MRTLFLILGSVIFITTSQDDEPHQPHTKDPGKCIKYCYPKGLDIKPKGTPEGIEGYECKGDHCAKAANGDEEAPCDEHGNYRCSTWCAPSCCSCLAVCI